MLVTNGCGKEENQLDAASGNIEGEAEDGQQENGSLKTEDVAETAKEAESSSTEKNEDAASESTYTWQEISITLPETWQEKYVIDEGDNGFSIYQKASYDIQKGAG